MKKYLYLMLLIAASCKNSSELKTINYRTSEHSIDVGYQGTSFYYVYTLQNSDSGEFLYYYDNMMKRISIIDFQNRKLMKHISLESDKFEINGINEFIFTDSAIIGRIANKFYWIQNDGIEAFKNIKTFEGNQFGEKFTYKLIQKNSQQQKINTEGDVFQFSALASDFGPEFFNTPIVSKVDLNAEVIINSKELNPSVRYKNNEETFGFRSDPFITEKEQYIYITFPFTPDIFVYDKRDLSLKKIKDLTSSHDIATNSPMLYKKFKEEYNAGIKNKSFEKQPYYHNLYFDSFRNLFYRPIRKPAMENQKKQDFSLSLLIFDAKLNLLGKLDLEDQYSPFLYISETGLYIRKKKLRENSIDLVRLDFDVP